MLAGDRHADRANASPRQGGPDPCSPAASQATAGEAVAVVLGRGPDAGRMLRSLLKLLSDCGVQPNRRMPPLDARALDIMGELVDAVPGLGVTDRLILARALADPYSVFLVTRDRALVNNAAIALCEKTPRERGRKSTPLRIVNPIETDLDF